MKSTRRFFAIVLTLALLLTNSGMATLAEAVLTMPAALQIIDEEAFYGDTSISKVVLSNKTTEIRARAFANSTLSEINLPASITFIDESAFDGLEQINITATEGSYAYQWAVDHGYIKESAALEITNVNCSVDGEIPLNKTVLWAVSTEADSDVQYEFVLLRRTKEVARQNYSARNYFRYTFANSGAYTLKITCEDEDGNTVSTTSSHTVQAGPLSIESVTTKSLDRILGDEIVWQVETDGGRDPLTYSYELTRNGAVIDTVDSSESSEYSCIANQAGSYVLNATCIDMDATIVSLSSDPVVVVGNVAMPVIKNNFSDAEGDAPEYEYGAIRIEWESVSGVSEYNIVLSQKAGNKYIEIMKTSISGDATSYYLQTALFEGITQKTLYKVSLSATSIGESDATEKYFCMLAADTALKDEITVDNKTILNIYHTTGQKGDYSYAIKSDYPTTVTSNAYWADATIENGLLRVYVQKDDSTFMHERKAILTIDNGHSTAVVNIYQVNADKTPSLINYDFSTNQNSPTSFPYGDIDLTFEGNGGTNSGAVYVFDLYQMNDNGTWTKKVQQINKEVVNGTFSIKYASSGITLGKLLRIEAKICGLSEYNAGSPQYRSNLTRNYYFKMVNSGHSITADGKQALEITSIGKTSVNIVANSSWTYSCESDWIGISIDNSYRFLSADTASLTITPTINDTTSSRTGTITLTCGSATATIKFTQPSCKPSVSVPTLSQSESSPSTLYGYTKNGADIQFMFRNVKEATWEYKSGSSYVTDTKHELYRNPMEEVYTYSTSISSYQLNTLYRLTVSNGNSSSVYYFKCSEQTGYVYLKKDNDTSDYMFWNPSSNGGSANYSVISNVSWTAQTDVSWLHLSKTSGTSNSSGTAFSVTADKNTTGALRIGVVTLKYGNNVMSYIRVNQNPVEYLSLFNCMNNRSIISEYNSSSDFKAVDGIGDEYYLMPSTNAYRLSYAADASWLDVSEDSKGKITIETTDNTGSASRTGHVTFTAGTVSKTVTITQVPAIGSVKDAITTPVLTNTSKTNPGVLQYGDLKVSWNKIANATKYSVRLTAPNDDDFYVTVNGGSQNSYTATIPASRIGTLQSGVYVLSIYAYDAYDYYRGTTLYFNFAMGDAVYIEGTTTPVWNNITDLGDDKDYIVQSSGAWTASTSQSWITVRTSSGSNGGTLSITVKPNTGSARSGKVGIKVNSTTTYLTVNQCAAIPEYPSLSSPVYSTDKANPTIIPASTTSIKTVWNVEPQANRYEVEIWQYSSTSLGAKVIGSGSLTNSEGQYTFTNLSLTKGQLYWIEFSRRNKRTTRSKKYYFMLDPGNTFVSVDGNTSQEYDEDARGGGNTYNITSSGVWTAKSSANWLMIGKKYIDEDYLVAHEDDAEDHLIHYGENGDKLYLYVFPNDTGASRTATVNVTSGGKKATIQVTQHQHYELAKITEPDLSITSDAPTLLPYMPLTVYWTKGEGGTGKYSVALYESDSPRIGFSRIMRDEGITVRSYAIPEYKLTENKYYKLTIGTEVADDDYYVNQYYFRIDSANPLRATLSLSSEEATVGSNFGVTVSASGGTGDYRYAYQLLRKGEIIQQTTYDVMTYYTFVTEDDDIYSIRVYVKDSSGTVIAVDSDDFVANQPEGAVLSGQVLIPEDNYYYSDYGNEGVTVTVSLVEDLTMSIKSTTKAVRSAPVTTSNVYTTTTDKDGKWRFLTGIAGAKYRVSYSKKNYQFESSSTQLVATSGQNLLNTVFGTPNSEAVTPDAISFNQYKDRDVVNITKLSSNLIFSWPTANNATSYIYSIKLLDGQPNSGDDEPGVSLAKNLLTKDREISIAKSDLQPGKWLKVWVASISSDGLRANNTIYLFLSDCDMAGEVVFDHYVNKQMLYLEDIDDLLTITWKDASDAIKYLVTAKILKGNPTSSSADEEIATLYYRDTLDSIPIAKKDLVPGTYLKVAVASVNAGDKERWSILSLYIESSAPDPKVTEKIELDPWFGDSAAFQHHTNDEAYAHVKKRINDIIYQSWAQTELREGRSIVFMFEGAGADSSTNKRMNALCIVVKNDNQGNPSCVFMNEYCSTIPDVVNEVNDYYVTTKGYKNCKNGTGTVLSDVYNFTATTYGGAKALSINGGGNVPSVRFKNTADIGTVTTSDGILLHRRYGNSPYTNPNSTRNSIGCFLIGKVESYEDTLSDFVYNSGRSGKVVVDRVCAVDYLREIYGRDQATLLYTYSK